MKEMTTKEIQSVILDIMKDVHEFCVENGVKYSLSGGSLLGAIRHNGFIPWDDDADIQMIRPEYEKFIHNYKSKRGYKIFCHEIKGGENVNRRLARICEMEKTYVDSGSCPWVDEDTGIAIDIIPVEGAPDNEKAAKKYINGLKNWDRMTMYWRTSKAPLSAILRYNSMKGRAEFLYRKFIGYFVPNDCIDRFINYQKKYAFDSSEYFCAGPHYGIREWQPKINMANYELHVFEDTEFYIMSGYKENLKSLFGDYMKLPPENLRVPHASKRYYWK